MGAAFVQLCPALLSRLLLCCVKQSQQSSLSVARLHRRRKNTHTHRVLRTNSRIERLIGLVGYIRRSKRRRSPTFPRINHKLCEPKWKLKLKTPPVPSSGIIELYAIIQRWGGGDGINNRQLIIMIRRCGGVRRY